MLKSLHIKQFTVFQDARFEFSAGLNIILGDNGTGKTHLLKLGYLFSRAWSDLTAKPSMVTTQRAESYLDERLLGLFKVSDLGMLVRQGYRGGARLVAAVGGHIPTLRIGMPNEPPFQSPDCRRPCLGISRFSAPRMRRGHSRQGWCPIRRQGMPSCPSRYLYRAKRWSPVQGPDRIVR